MKEALKATSRLVTATQEEISKNQEDYFLPDFSEVVKAARQRLNLTQVTLAKLSDLQPAEISRIEGGQTKKPSKEVIKALAPYLGYEYSYLLLCAGHSGHIHDYIFYTKSGDKIPYFDIVKNIYHADSDLLTELKNINELTLSDIDILKKLIRLMKKTSGDSNCADSKTRKENLNSITKLFNTVRIFLATQLSVLLEMY